MEVKILLKQFSLSDKETAVYLSLVETGPSPVRVIAEKSGVNRGTTYDILSSLKNQGLISFQNKGKYQYFVAESPTKLVQVIERRQTELDHVKKNIVANLPVLQATFGQQGGRPVVKMYEGPEGLKQILLDVLETMDLQTNKTYFVYSSANVRKSIYDAMPDFSPRRVKKNIKVRSIALGEGGQMVGLDERRWLNTKQKDLSHTYEIIYGGKVAQISLDNTSNPLGVVFENWGIYETQKLIFETLWEKLPTPKL